MYLAATSNLTGSYVFAAAPFEVELATIAWLVNDRLTHSGMMVVHGHPSHAFVWVDEAPMSASPPAPSSPPGDAIEFVNNRPAHASGFAASASLMAQPPAGAGRWGKLRCPSFAS